MLCRKPGSVKGISQRTLHLNYGNGGPETGARSQMLWRAPRSCYEPNTFWRETQGTDVAHTDPCAMRFFPRQKSVQNFLPPRYRRNDSVNCPRFWCSVFLCNPTSKLLIVARMGVACFPGTLSLLNGGVV